MTEAQPSPRDLSKPVFWGFLAVGFLSLLGGIAMFIYVVPKDLDRDAAPRDASVIFTEVFTRQIQLFEDRKRYAAALPEIEVPSDVCERYHCRLTVPPDGQDYTFRLSRDDHTWLITSKSPVPKKEN